MAFPSSPVNNQQATVNDIVYVYNSAKGAWLRLSSAGIATANLTVAAVITDNYYYADGTTVIGTNKSVYTGTVTATTSATLIDTIPAAGNTSVTWTLTSKDNTNSRYKTSMLGSLNDGTNVYYNEYGIILSNSSFDVTTFTSNISSGNVNLYAVGDSSNVTVAFQRVSLGTSTATGYLMNGARGFDGAKGDTGNINSTSGDIVTTSTTTATSTITGALRVAGGAGIVGDLYAATFNGINLAANLGAISGSLATLTANAGAQAGSIAAKADLSGASFTGPVSVSGNLTVTGNLFINGNTTTINSNNLTVNDSMIYLADDNPADTLDIGFVSAFTDATRYQHTGLVRDATDGVWKLFANVVAEPTTTVNFDSATYANLLVGNLFVGRFQQPAVTSLGVAGGIQFGDPDLIGGRANIVVSSYGYITLHATANITYRAPERHEFINEVHVTSDLYAVGNVFLSAGNNPSSGVNVHASTTSTSTTTGAVVVRGGIGVGGNINAGGNLTVGQNLNVSGEINTSGTVTALNILNPFLLAGM